MSKGFGVFAVGLGAFGLATPDVAPDPATGPVGSRWINSATKDYEVNEATGNLKQMPGVRQQVFLAISTIQGTANPNPRFGIRLPNKMNNSFENECKSAVKSALSHLTDVDPPIIEINKIQVTKGRNSRAEILIDYTDLSTGEPDQVHN